MRVREANTRILRAKPQADIDATSIESQLAMPRINGLLYPWRIELCAGRERKENAAATQSGTHFPNGDLGGKPVPEYRLRLGRSFRMTPQAETASRNRATERDTLSQWRLKRKLRPGIDTQNGMRFPDGLLAESSSRNPRSERDILSGWLLRRKLRPRICPETGTRFPNGDPGGNCDPESTLKPGRAFRQPPRLLNSKTRAPFIPKLGRRYLKRNRRRST